MHDPHSALRVSIKIAPRIVQSPAEPEPMNGPGRPDRANGRAPAIERTNKVRPRRLGHVVVGSLDQDASQQFFTRGLGFKVTDHVPGLASFLRCSTDHHNLLLQQAPLNFLHHSAWEVDDVDEVGRGATPCSKSIPSGTCGAWAATISGRISSGTSRTRPATSRSITPIWTASR